jgi:hypothetical protein
MPFAQTQNPNIESVLTPRLQDTSLKSTHSVLFSTSDAIQVTLDTSHNNEVSLVVDTLSVSLGFPKLDIQLSRLFATYVYN